MDYRQIQSILKQQHASGDSWQVKQAVLDAKNIYRDDWDYIIHQELKEQFTQATYKDLLFLITKELNILKRAVNEISMIYKRPASRVCYLDGDEEHTAIERYNEISEDMDLDNIGKQINRYTNLTNATLNRIVLRDDKFDVDVMTFDMCDIVTDPNDFKKIIAVKIYMGIKLPGFISDNNIEVTNDTIKFDDAARYNHPGSTLGSTPEYSRAKLYTLEDDGSWIYDIECSENGDEYIDSTNRIPNPYVDVYGKPILPFVLVTRTHPIDKLLDFTTGADLIDITIQTAVNLVHLNQLFKFQSWKQIWIIAEDLKTIGKELVANPNSVWGIPASRETTTSIGTLDLQTDIQRQLSFIVERIKLVLAQYGIDSESFTRSGSAESGFKLQVKKEGLNELRADQLATYKKMEKDIFNIVRAINNYHYPSDLIPADSKLDVQFAEIEIAHDKEAEARRWEMEIRNNVSTPIDWISDEYDLSNEEAEERFNQNKMYNRSNAIPLTGFTNPTGTLNA